ncbi:hypothetical protein NC651_022252 [Populus alba x Populus x berolinensis]|nr:hypothetical protein NC651_022252 [Populus alba x Populus x berolinensis]
MPAWRNTEPLNLTPPKVPSIKLTCPLAFRTTSSPLFHKQQGASQTVKARKSQFTGLKYSKLTQHYLKCSRYVYKKNSESLINSQSVTNQRSLFCEGIPIFIYHSFVTE